MGSTSTSSEFHWEAEAVKAKYILWPVGRALARFVPQALFLFAISFIIFRMIVVLHNIRSLHNAGSIFRTADAVGIEKIYLCGITPAPIDRFDTPRGQFVKVSLGAEKNVVWEKVSSAPALLKKLKKDGYTIFAIEQDKHAVPYYGVKLKGTFPRESGIALVLGNEIKGLPSSILRHADKILEIPMVGKMVRHADHPKHLRREIRTKESLNVGVAFGVVVFHLINSRPVTRDL